MAQFNTENQSLKNFVKVLETDSQKLDDMEAKLEQVQQLYDKEKDLNAQLLNSAQEEEENDSQSGEDDGDETGEEGEENAMPAATGSAAVKVTSSKTE